MSKAANSHLNTAIHAKQTELLFRNVGSAQVITVLVTISTTYLGYISRPGPVILIWMFCMLAMSFLRYRHALRYMAVNPPADQASVWSSQYIRLLGLHSVIWGAGCGAVMWGNADAYRFMIVVIMVGMVAGAVSTLSAVKVAFKLYAVPMMLAASLISFANATSPVHWVLGILSLVFLAGVLRGSGYLHGMLLETFTLELEKSQLVEKAEAANRIKSEFLANISHEIRTPMNSILGMAQLALRAEQNPKQRDYLRKIQLSGEHLLSIIGDVLDLSKIDAGKLTIETVDFEFGNVMVNVSNLVAEKAKQKNLKLAFDIDPAIPHFLRGDPLRLSQVLANLINNAIKFTEQGEVVLRVKKLSADGDLRFEVQDTGIGISRADRARLFQPFQQADSSITRKYGGTGLGLVICKQLVEMMEGGHIGVDSTPGKGSTFWFTVRLAEGREPTLQQAEAQWQEGDKNEPAVQQAIQGARILVVDDNTFNLEVASDFLKEAGAVVSIAYDGQEALDRLRRERFDCVLMDVQMPVMDGVEAARLIRADPAIADVHVIAMTANAMKEDRERYLSAGMDDFVSKPFQYHNFFTTLAKWLPKNEPAELLPDSAVSPLAIMENENMTNTPAVIDLAVLANMIGNDRKKLYEFAHKFVASIQKDMEAIEAALERKDMAELGALGHRNKTPARMVGAMGYADLCEALEKNAQLGDLKRAQDIVRQLRPLPGNIQEYVAKEFA